ncbi:unnamed protein product [Brassica rapa subsp. trilocularis]
MLEWSLGFEVADNGISVGEEMLVVHWRRNHKKKRSRVKLSITHVTRLCCPQNMDKFFLRNRFGCSVLYVGFESVLFGYGSYESLKLRPI